MLFHQSEDYRPLFWMGGRPIYVTTLLILLHIAAFIAVALSISFTGGGAINLLELDSYSVLHGEVWRLASYIVFPPSLWFVFAMGFLFFAGREVEQYVGRKVFINLYIALVLIPAALISLLGYFLPLQPVLGGTESIFGVFVAFATLYPGIVLNIWFVNLTTKGWAWILLAVYSLIDVAFHQWSALLVLWMCAEVGYFGMRLIGAGRGFEWLTNWLDERRTQRLARAHNIKVLEEKKATDSIDAILEKISKQGVASLDSRERAALERARTDLLKRDQR